MKVIGVVVSPRKNGNTEMLTGHVLRAIGEEGLRTELQLLAGLDIRPCNGCGACLKEESCTIEDDFWPVYLNMKTADGIILASPVYYGSATALMKALMERAGYISRNNGGQFRGKVGGPLVVARRAGHNFTIAQLTFWFQILGMVVPGSTYWNVAFGRNKGEVAGDEEGLSTAWNFGKNIAWVTRKLRGNEAGQPGIMINKTFQER
ncbi:MAG: flavodoxin family protein [Chloroflexi bacterium]|nr:flavodoxin family protein [Chloroflexota bacterium]